MSLYTPPMPGSFILDSSSAAPPKLDLDTSAKGSKVFLPPRTPSAASSLHRNVSASQSQITGARKRTRYDYTDDEASGYYSTGTMSPAPLANSQYSLAGGLDTPTASTTAAFEMPRVVDQEQDYRPNRANQYTQSHHDEYFPFENGGLLSRERNGCGRAYRSGGPGWSRTVFNVVGDVAGRVWNFCWAGAFQGFYAGGGRGYGMKLPADSHEWPVMSEKDDVFNNAYEGDSKPPGGFPDEDLVPDYMPRKHMNSHATPPRASKKIVREHSENGLCGNWIMVSSSPQSRDGSPGRSTQRKLPRHSNPSLRCPVTASRPGRRTILAPSRPSLTPQHTGSPARLSSSSRTASSSFHKPPLSTPPTTTSTALRPAETKTESPLSPDAQRQISRTRRREKQEDASIRRMTQQLDALIKQGKEALGTKVEVVEDEDEDEDEVSGDIVDEGYGGEVEDYRMEKCFRRPWDDEYRSTGT